MNACWWESAHLYHSPLCYGLTVMNFRSWSLDGITCFKSYTIILQLREVRPGEGVTCPWSCSWWSLELGTHSPSSQCPSFSTKMGRNALSEHGWKADVISPRDGEFGKKGPQGELHGGGHLSLSSTPTWSLCSPDTPSNDGIFNKWEGSRSFSFPLPPPTPATIVISCQKFLDGRGNVQVLMRWYSKDFISSWIWH